jgi:viologen exporter family transport system permease protein
MNVRGAWALIKRTWTEWLQHRGFFFLLAFGWMVPPLIYLFVWSTAAGKETIGGLSRGEFVAYYLVLIVVNQVTYPQTNWTVGDVIRSGGMNALLLRPMSPFWNAVAARVSGLVVYMAFVIPVTAILALALRPELNVTTRNGLAFVAALVLAGLLRFFWAYWLALLAFWTTRSDALLALQDAFVFLLAGQVAPVVLLPDAMRGIAYVLPFRYMLGFPVEVLTGQLDAIALWSGFSYQAAWLAVALILYAVLWRTGVKRYSAVGG